eukprot:gene42033-52143_t
MKRIALAVAATLMITPALVGSAYAGNIGVTMANSDTFLTVLRNGI